MTYSEKRKRVVMLLAHDFRYPYLDARVYKEAKSLDKGIEALYRERRKKEKEKQERVLKMLRDDDRKIIELIINSGGEIYQAKLIEKTDFSRAKVTRVLDKLENKGLIERRRDGMSNIVSFKKL